jgi:hypothetical protein
MRKINFLFLTLFLSFFIFSCQEDDGEPNDNNVDLDIIIADTNSYFPMSEGSWWEYRSILTGFEEFYKITSGETIDIDGKQYFQLIVDLDSASVLYRYENGKLFRLLSPQETGASKSFEILYLDEDAEVGDIWYSEAFIANGQTFRFKREIAEKLESTLFADQEFNDVIHLVQTTQYKPNPNIDWFDTFYSDEYYARGIGYLGMKGDTGDEGLSLLDYEIK